MGATKVNRNDQLEKETNSHVGTWFFLGAVGAVILITYFVLFGLYMGRV